MKYLFWNTKNNKEINDILEKIIMCLQIDIVGLAEYSGDGDVLVDMLKQHNLDYRYIPHIGSRIDIICRITDCAHGSDAPYYTNKICKEDDKSKQVVSFVHFPSKMHTEPEAMQELVRDMLEDINKDARKNGTDDIVIVGDFNMNPYENNMVQATGLHAIGNKTIVKEKRGIRTFRKKKRKMFYNPMWNFLGDRGTVGGSYYFSSPNNMTNYWNVLDQFLVSVSLVDKINYDSIRFITDEAGVLLIKQNGRPKESDHFPLYFEIGG